MFFSRKKRESIFSSLLSLKSRKNNDEEDDISLDELNNALSQAQKEKNYILMVELKKRIKEKKKNLSKEQKNKFFVYFFLLSILLFCFYYFFYVLDGINTSDYQKSYKESQNKISEVNLKIRKIQLKKRAKELGIYGLYEKNQKLIIDISSTPFIEKTEFQIYKTKKKFFLPAGKSVIKLKMKNNKTLYILQGLNRNIFLERI